MASNSIPAAFGVTQFLWSKIVDAGILGDAGDEDSAKAAYGGLVPIVPIQEEPNLLQAIAEQPGVTTAPYIVYTWYNNGFATNWYSTASDQVVYIVNSLDQSKLRQLTLLIIHWLQRYDESARAVNEFVQSQAPNSTVDAPVYNFSQEYRNYYYTNISVQMATGGVPGTLENEPVKASLTVRVGYTNTNNDYPL